MSKGSKRRPTLISDEQFKAEWDRIFNRDEDKTEADAEGMAQTVRHGPLEAFEEGATS